MTDVREVRVLIKLIKSVEHAVVIYVILCIFRRLSHHLTRSVTSLLFSVVIYEIILSVKWFGGKHHVVRHG